MEEATLTYNAQVEIAENCKRVLEEEGYFDEDVCEGLTPEAKRAKFDEIKEIVDKEKAKLPKKIDEMVEECFDSAILNRNSRNSSKFASTPISTIPLSSVAESNYEKSLETKRGKSDDVEEETDLLTVDGQVQLLVDSCKFKISKDDKKKKGGKTFIRFLAGKDMTGVSHIGMKRTIERAHEYGTDKRQSFAEERLEALELATQNCSLG